MILYVNGDNHTGAVMATNRYINATEDPKYWNLIDRTHPDNLKVSWGVKLAEMLKMQFHTTHIVDSSNEQIILDTKKWLDEATKITNVDVFVIIGWYPVVDPGPINDLGELLTEKEIPYLFFHTDIPQQQINEPVLPTSMIEHLTDIGIEPVLLSDCYYGNDGHSAWAKYIAKYINKHKLI